MTDRPEVIERHATDHGELVLRRAGGHYEIIANGVFLMDTRDGRSERLLVRAALDRCRRPCNLLIGGLGVGFSLAEALATPDCRVTVVEREPAVIAWQSTHLARYSAGALADPRVRVVCGDLVEWSFTTPTPAFDAICLDIDNGPDWTVSEGNAALYGDEGLRRLRRQLIPGGVLAVWSANVSPAFEARLGEHFTDVEVATVDCGERYSNRRPHPGSWGSGGSGPRVNTAGPGAGGQRPTSSGARLGEPREPNSNQQPQPTIAGARGARPPQVDTAAHGEADLRSASMPNGLVQVARGEPDVIYTAVSPRSRTA